MHKSRVVLGLDNSLHNTSTPSQHISTIIHPTLQLPSKRLFFTMHSILAGLTLLAALVTAKTTPGPGDLNCPSGVHVIVARASQEAPGPGIMGQVANTVLERIPGSDMESLDYPALLDPYVPSQTAGVANLTTLIQKYSEKCPRTKMVLMGYSQVS